MNKATDNIKNIIILSSIMVLTVFAVIFAGNPEITGNFIGNQDVIKIGVLEPVERYYYRNHEMVRGIETSISQREANEFAFDILKKNNTDLGAAMNSFILDDVTAIFVPDTYDVSKISEITNDNKILMFFPTGSLSLYDFGDYVFYLNDFFVIPTVILADTANNMNLKKVGVVYVKSPIDINDDTTDIFIETLSSMSGEISFETIYDITDVDDSMEIFDLINSTTPDAIIFLGYGTFYEEFSVLLSKVRKINSDIEIMSLGLGTKYENKLINDSFTDIIFPETAYNITDFYDTDSLYAFSVEGYISIEILEDLVIHCGHDRECMQKKLHNEIFDTSLGEVDFTNTGIMIRPYSLKKVEKSGGFEIIENYSVDKIMKMADDYNLVFLK